jgi:hypothetical protein
MSTATGDVIAVFDRAGYGLLLNVRTHKYHPINRTMGKLWCWLADGTPQHVAEQALAGDYPEVPAKTLRTDTEAALRQLETYALLPATQSKRAPLAGRYAASKPLPSRRVAVTDLSEPVPVHFRVIGFVGFVIAVVLMRLPFPIMLRILRASSRIRAQNPTVADTKQMLAAVGRIAAHHPGWAECYEISIGARIALTMLGKPPAWLLLAVFGTKVTLHGCLEVDDTLIDDKPQTRNENQPLIRI